MDASPAILARDLTAYFGKVPGIVGLDLRVERGEVFGFLGPNGSGKTTTIRLLLDLLRPDRGEVSILGGAVRGRGSVWRSRVGFLPGDLALFPDLSGRRTLRLFAALSGRPPVLAESVLERLRFPRERLDRSVGEYSTGMRQALGIVCAFQHDPDLLILDEPTTGLDPLVRDAFLHLVRDRRDAGNTVFLSSHVLDEIERCADRVGLVHRARLLLVDSVEALRRSLPRSVTIRRRGGAVEHFTHSGDPGELLRTLAATELEDVAIHPPSLEEIFRARVEAGDSP